MPRRKELRGVAFALLGAFMGRNNDVSGYWALGKLYRHATASNSREIQIDLVRSTITPQGAEFDRMVARFRQMLADRMVTRRLPIEWLRGVHVRVIFDGETSAAGQGDAFECSVTINDDLDHLHQARGNGACWIHDPHKERKSGRVESASDG